MHTDLLTVILLKDRFLLSGLGVPLSHEILMLGRHLLRLLLGVIRCRHIAATRRHLASADHNDLLVLVGRCCLPQLTRGKSTGLCLRLRRRRLYGIRCIYVFIVIELG